ncbi:MAG TPA: FHA domain-containing protein [Vicinamibacterales bacterium]
MQKFFFFAFCILPSAFTLWPRMWTLQSVEPEDVGLTFRLLPGTLKTMGRAPRADFVVDAALVSRVHCRFVLNDRGELELEDLGSTNGTFVNGKKITRATLSDGDKLTIGRVLFLVNAVSNGSDTSTTSTVTS